MLNPFIIHYLIWLDSARKERYDAGVTTTPSYPTSECLFVQANTLLADHLFSPALFLAERIERGLIPLQGKTGQYLILVATFYQHLWWPERLPSPLLTCLH